MFAILETGGKQYRVEPGDIIEVERIDHSKISNQNKVSFDSVLLIKDQDLHIGQPYVKNGRIVAKILDEFKDKKIIVFKKKSKKGYKKTRGHRQLLHRIEIEKIELGAAAPVEKKTEAKKEEKPEKATRKPAPQKAAVKPETKEAAVQKEVKKPAPKKTTAKKTPTKKTAAKETVAKKTTAKKPTAKKATPKTDTKGEKAKPEEKKPIKKAPPKKQAKKEEKS